MWEIPLQRDNRTAHLCQHLPQVEKKKFWLLLYVVIEGTLDCVLDYEFSFKLALGFDVFGC